MQPISLIVVGDTLVGKTASVVYYCSQEDATTYSAATVGIDFMKKEVEYEGKTIPIRIWDTAGQERFRSLATSFFKRTNGVAICYDITDRVTFEHCAYWMDQVVTKSQIGVPVILIANKIDLESDRVVSYEEGKAVADQYCIPFFETSAKDGRGINEAFGKLVNDVLARKLPCRGSEEPKAVEIEETAEKKGCC